VVIKSGFIVCVVLAMAGMVGGGKAAQAPAASQQPEFTTLKADFVPGEKTIFFDDFTDMGPGDAPPHFKARGAAPELKAAGVLRQLTITHDGILSPNVTALPKNFTYEAEAALEPPNGRVNIFFSLYSKGREAFVWVVYVGTTPTTTDVVASVNVPKFEELGRKRFNLDWKQPVKLALWVQNGRLRVFVNGERQIDANQVDLPPIDRVEIRTAIHGPGSSIGYRSVRFAESTPDFSQVIAASGRYVSHGILFDTGLDRLKPESAPVIQAVAKGLDTNPTLKLLIEGHTDSAGDAAQNLDLSRRRAEAVKAVLVTQFKMDASRLTTAGLGATKPIDSNDTPQGRSQTRRVELVKQ
jgi:OOP family OmpA-OmpF porin